MITIADKILNKSKIIGKSRSILLINRIAIAYYKHWNDSGKQYVFADKSRICINEYSANWIYKYKLDI